MVRASHLAESESPGRPCNDAQVHAEQDSLSSPLLRLVFSVSVSLSLSTFYYCLPPPPLPPPSSSSAQWHGRAEHLFLRRFGLLWSSRPSTAPRRPSKTPQSRRQLLTSPPRTPSPASSFPPSSFSHLFHLFVLLRRTFDSPYFALLARYDTQVYITHTRAH